MNIAMVLNKILSLNENNIFMKKNNKSFNVKEYKICEFYSSTKSLNEKSKCWIKIMTLNVNEFIRN